MAVEPVLSQTRRLADGPGGRVSGWVLRTWESGGHLSLRCCAVIRRTSGSCGLFELFVSLIIRLGYSALHQAHKDLIYSLTGNERTQQSWRIQGLLALLTGDRADGQPATELNAHKHLSSAPPLLPC